MTAKPSRAPSRVPGALSRRTVARTGGATGTKIDEVSLPSLKLEVVAVNSSSPTPNGFPPNAAE